jgi:hypothetical protein
VKIICTNMSIIPVNTIRAFNGLPPLETCNDCMVTAQEHANRFVLECDEVGRVIAMGGADMKMDDVVASWVSVELWGDSPDVKITGDMKTLLEGDITDAGIGVCRRLGQTLIVVDFH